MPSPVWLAKRRPEADRLGKMASLATRRFENSGGKYCAPARDWARVGSTVLVEARGVEPLSSKLSTQASTCVAGEIFKGPNFAPAHCQPPIVHEILSPSGAVAPPDD